MKWGFQLEIQNNLSNEEHKKALEYANKFIINTLNDSKKRFGGHNTKGGYESYWKRGTFGFQFDRGSLVCRRISNNRRVFAIVRTEELELVEGSGCDCICPHHRGGAKAKWKNGKPKTFIYIKMGEIKG